VPCLRQWNKGRLSCVSLLQEKIKKLMYKMWKTTEPKLEGLSVLQNYSVAERLEAGGGCNSLRQ